MFDDLDEIYFSDSRIKTIYNDDSNPMKTPEIPVDYIKIDINKNVDDQKEKCELDDNVPVYIIFNKIFLLNIYYI